VGSGNVIGNSIKNCRGSFGVPVAPPYIINSATSLRSSPSLRSSTSSLNLLLEYSKCELCRYGYAERICPICGRRVCRRDYDETLNMCSACREALCNVCNRNLSVSRCCICGRLVCAKCSIDLDGVRRVCFLCIISASLNL